MPAISTVIPVLNDAAALERCLSALKECAGFDSCEVIVADGDGSDEIRNISSQFNAVYVSSLPGRAVQMNCGAGLARGEWLWFLHADCIPDPGSLAAISGLDRQAMWGCFKNRIDHEHFALRVIERGDRIRARSFSLPYGDQGIFVRAKTFREIGGYEDVPLLEDVTLSQRLAEFNSPRVLHPILRTDARRWLRNGIVKTTWKNWRVMFDYLLKRKTPQELAAFYRKS